MQNDEGRRGSVTLAVTGVTVALLGVIAYFVVALQLGAWLPSIRNHAIPNWILVALGIVVSMFAVARARRRLVPALLLGLNVALATLFAGFLYVFSAVPPTSGPAIGAPAPGFALLDQGSRTVRLEDFRGAPLLLVFYRGHW